MHKEKSKIFLCIVICNTQKKIKQIQFNTMSINKLLNSITVDEFLQVEETALKFSSLYFVICPANDGFVFFIQ